MFRAPLLALTWASYMMPSEGQYAMWHGIDAMAAVCDPIPAPVPLPAGVDAWPTKKEFPIVIEVANGMRPDNPHSVTFLRTRMTAVSITFHVTDKAGLEVLPTTTVDLPDVSSGETSNGCECTGINLGVDTAKYGANFGTTCQAWDAQMCSTWYPAGTQGEQCCKSWCYVSQSCSDAFTDDLYEGVWRSYQGACGKDLLPGCTYVEPDPCECQNVDATTQFVSNVSKFGAGYGAKCQNWDYNDCADKFAVDVIGSFCCETWCWVKSTCSTSVASTVWPGLYWSTLQCSDDQMLVSTCPYKKYTGLTAAEEAAACACTQQSPVQLTNGRRRAGKAFPATYGTTCAAWDAVDCASYFPADTPNIWCCRSWCYVDAACPSAKPSLLVFGQYWSYETCPADGAVLASCAHSNACQPTGVNTGVDTTKFGITYGKTCKAWDATNCKEWYGGTDLWNETNKDWCCASWAYVLPTCPLAVLSSVSLALSMAYDVCGEDSSPVYQEGSDSCAAARRLGDGDGTHGSEVEVADWHRPEDEVTVTPRRLASRRRARSPAPPPSRRRAPTRRRAPPPGPPSSVAQADTRRRRTPDGDTSPRRRQTSVAGKTWSTDSSTPRRRASTGDVRRRETSYGYTSKPQMQGNYNGQMPQKTAYGYSGNSYQKNSKVPMMMAGGAGLVAGAAVGVGAYYMYSRMSRNNWNAGANDRSYCPVPGGSGQMRCDDCYQRYGSQCKAQNSCYEGSGGCQQSMSSDTHRDDIMTAGFVPAEWTSPLTVTITAITGPGYLPAEICPVEQPDTGTYDDEWEKASSFNIELFMTLTELESLDPQEEFATTLDPRAGSGLINAGYSRAGSCWLPGILLPLVLFFGSRRLRM